MAKKKQQEEARQEAQEEVAASPNAEAAEEDTEDTDDRVRNSRKGTREEDYRVFTNLEEARAGRPEGKEAWWLFQVTDPAGEHRWTWSAYMDRALWNVCEEDGWVVMGVEDLPSTNEVAAMLTAMSPADRAALLAKFK